MENGRYISGVSWLIMIQTVSEAIALSSPWQKSCGSA